MSKGLEAFNIVKEECGYAFGGTANGDRVRANLPIVEKELKAFEIITKYPEADHSLNYLLNMMKYWEEEKRPITKTLLQIYDFPYEVEEYYLLKEVLL